MPAPDKQETVIKQNPSSVAYDNFYDNPQLDDVAAKANGVIQEGVVTIHAPELLAEAADAEVVYVEEDSIDFDPSEANVDEVLEFMDSHPEEVEKVLKAERSGKNRKTVRK